MSASAINFFARQSDWSTAPFTMNWKLTRPGKYTFHKGEPFAFLMPVPHFEMEALEPKVYSLDSHPELKGAYEEWSQKRAEFNQRLHDNDPEAVKEGWQRWYTRGETPDGKKVEVRHTSKRKMKKLVPGEPGTATEPAR